MSRHTYIVVVLVSVSAMVLGCNHDARPVADEPVRETGSETDDTADQERGAEPKVREQRYRDALESGSRDSAEELAESARIRDALVEMGDEVDAELTNVRCSTSSCYYVFQHDSELDLLAFHPDGFQRVVYRDDCFVRLDTEKFVTFGICATEGGALPHISLTAD